jgi:RimJ/RimL family protein N-acetyltransferase
VPRSRYQISWSTPRGFLCAIEPYPEEVERHAATLAAAYNDPQNAPLLGHTELLAERDVVAHYAQLADHRGHGFLVFRDDMLVADGDLRDVSDGAAELAFLVADPAAQGKGLGTQIATMFHAFAFGLLRLDRVYASIVPHNVASRRVFEKLGYRIETGPAALAHAEEDGDIVMVVDRPAFAQSHAQQLAAIHVAMRRPRPEISQVDFRT